MLTKSLRLSLYVLLLVGTLSGILSAENILFEQEPERVVSNENSALAKKARMTVFIDFYCPHCHQFEREIIPLLRKEFGNQLEIKTMGLPVIRKESSELISIFLSAQRYGKGEQMKDLLFKMIHESSKDPKDRDLKETIRKAELDPDKIFELAKSDEIQNQMRSEIELARHFGIFATPGIVINETVRVDDHSLSNLASVIRSSLR